MPRSPPRRQSRRAGNGGEHQRLTICRTLMGDPSLIMIDEPTEGLAPLLGRMVFEGSPEELRRHETVRREWLEV